MSTQTAPAKPETPTRLEHFDESKAIVHPSFPTQRLFMVNDPTYGSGVWSATQGMIIVPLSEHSKHGTFYPIVSVMPTGKIFWGAKTRDGDFYSLYVAGATAECAVRADLPREHSLVRVLSGKIMLLKSKDHTEHRPYRLYSLETNTAQILDVGANGEPHSFFVPKNGKQVMLVFQPRDPSVFATAAGIFLIEEEAFTIERLPEDSNC